MHGAPLNQGGLGLEDGRARPGHWISDKRFFGPPPRGVRTNTLLTEPSPRKRLLFGADFAAVDPLAEHIEGPFAMKRVTTVLC
jgi:hypothetical protein